MRLRWAGLGTAWRLGGRPAGDESPEAGPPVTNETRGRGDAVGAWLDVLCRLLRLPREQTESIRVELEEHLRERVRDLMVEGQPEDAAARRAIEELGDAAVLADRFRRAEHTPRRRMIMNIALLGMAAGAVVLGTTAVNRMNAPPPTQIGAALPAETRFAGKEVADKTITLGAEATLEKLVAELAKASGHPAHAYWDKLGEAGFAQDVAIGVPLSGVSIETALMIANERLAGPGGRLACRVTGNLLEVSTLAHFDKRDITLVAYDVSGVLAGAPAGKSTEEVTEELLNLITGVVDPEQWKAHGGELAELHKVGTKLFVHAPARFHPTVEWILAQMGSGKVAAAAGGAEIRRWPETYTVKPGDTWRSIAREQLGDPERWMSLVWANDAHNPPAGATPGSSRALQMPDAEAAAARYAVAPTSPASFRAQHEDDSTMWRRIVALNPRLEVDWISGRILRLPPSANSAQTKFTAEGNRTTAAHDGQSITADSITVGPGNVLGATGANVKTGERRPAGGAAGATGATVGTVFVSGVPCAGVYAVPEGGLTVRRILVSAAVRLEDVHEVIVSKTVDGKSVVRERIIGEEIRAENGRDPAVVPGDLIEVK